MKPRGRSAPSFSVVTMVRNEAARLPRLLDSIALFRARGGEVVVLDTGSDDGTPKIAENAGCRVFRDPRPFDRRLTEGQAERIHKAFARGGEGPFLAAGDRTFNMAAARNRAAAMASHPFQLAVDGSDLVEAMDIDYLDATLRSNQFQIILFETRRLHQDRWFIENRDYFYDRRFTIWRGRAHNFVASARPGIAKATVAPRDRLRVSHHTDPTKSRSHQLAGVLLDALDTPHSPKRGFLVGRELAIRGHFQSALSAYLALDRAGVLPSLRAAALSMAASCLAETAVGGAEDDVNEMLFKAARRDPGRRDPWLQLAKRALAKSDFQAAVSFATAALAIPPRVAFSELEENQREGPHATLYWALFWLGRRSEAREHFRICLGLEPQNEAYREHARMFR